MITKSIWDTVVFDDYDWGYKERIDIYKIFISLLLSPAAILFDILTFPIQIIALIIYKIIERTMNR